MAVFPKHHSWLLLGKQTIGGAGQPVTGENFVVMQFLDKELEQSEFLFRSLPPQPPISQSDVYSLG